MWWYKKRIERLEREVEKIKASLKSPIVDWTFQNTANTTTTNPVEVTYHPLGHSPKKGKE